MSKTKEEILLNSFYISNWKKICINNNFLYAKKENRIGIFSFENEITFIRSFQVPVIQDNLCFQKHTNNLLMFEDEILYVFSDENFLYKIDFKDIILDVKTDYKGDIYVLTEENIHKYSSKGTILKNIKCSKNTIKLLNYKNKIVTIQSPCNIYDIELKKYILFFDFEAKNICFFENCFYFSTKNGFGKLNNGNIEFVKQKAVYDIFPQEDFVILIIGGFLRKKNFEKIQSKNLKMIFFTEISSLKNVINFHFENYQRRKEDIVYFPAKIKFFDNVKYVSPEARLDFNNAEWKIYTKSIKIFSENEVEFTVLGHIPWKYKFNFDKKMKKWVAINEFLPKEGLVYYLEL